MGEAEIREFLSDLPVKRRVAASTRNRSVKRLAFPVPRGAQATPALHIRDRTSKATGPAASGLHAR